MILQSTNTPKHYNNYLKARSYEQPKGENNMWIPIVVRHDTGFLRITQRPMIEHIADKLNELETKHGAIKILSFVQVEIDKYAEFLVWVDTNNDLPRTWFLRDYWPEP